MPFKILLIIASLFFMPTAATAEQPRVIHADELMQCCGIEPYAEQLAAHLTKLANSHPDCIARLEPYNAGKSSTKGTPENPEFFVQCGDGTNPTMIRFSLEDMQAGKIAKKLEPMDHADAITACEKAVRLRARDDSIRFSIWDSYYQAQPNAQVMTRNGYTVENMFGGESKVYFTCFFDPDGSLRTIEIDE